MSGSTRHTACKLCRERKVRCDGAQPTCEKCSIAGETCVYLPMQKPTKADLTQTMEALQKRLQDTEAQLTALGNQSQGISLAHHQQYSPSADWHTSPFNFMHPQGFLGEVSNVPPTLYNMPNQYLQMASDPDRSPSSHSHFNVADWQRIGDVSRGYPFQVPFAPMRDPSPMFNPFGLQTSTSHVEQQSVPAAASERASDNSRPPSSRRNGSRGNDAAQMREDDVTRRSDTDMDTDGSWQHNATSSHDTPASSVGSHHMIPAGNRGTSEDLASPGFAQIAAFMASIFQTQAEIAGISSVVADYVNWMCKAPTRNSGSETALVSISMLETVEKRLRELRSIAESRHKAAFENLIQSLHVLGPAAYATAANMRGLDKDLQKTAQEYADFFSKRYNACAAVADQLDKIPQGLSGSQNGSVHSSGQ